MRTLPFAVAILLFSSTLAAQLQPASDAVAVDPTTHNVLLDNEHVRVFRVLASAGHTSPMHTHPPTVLVSLGRARLNQTFPDGSSAIYDFEPGDVVWLDSHEHSWEMLSGHGHIVGIEVKAAASGVQREVPALPPTDAVNQDPTHHQVLFENDHVRVFKAMAGAGATSPMHTHPPMVLVSAGSTRFDIQPGEGPSRLFDFHPGQVVWVPGTQHAWTLVAGELQVTGVEIKAAR